MATVVGTVDALLDISGTHPQTTRQCHLDAHSDEDLLVAVLDEQIHLMDTTGDVPIDAELEPVEEGVDVRFAMVDAATVPQIGVVPKAVTLHELWLAEGPTGGRAR